MDENDLTRTFRELEEAVEELLKRRTKSPEKKGVSSAVSGRKRPDRAATSDRVVDEEAIELIRRAIKRLKSLY